MKKRITKATFVCLIGLLFMSETPSHLDRVVFCGFESSLFKMDLLYSEGNDVTLFPFVASYSSDGINDVPCYTIIRDSIKASGMHIGTGQIREAKTKYIK